MKNLLCVFIILLGMSCKKDQFPYQSDIEVSQQKWDSFKASISNNYTYTTSMYNTVGIGQYSETKITVQSGVVIARMYTLHATNLNGTLLTTWTEDQSNLNSHTGGTQSLTLDEVYQKAKSEWLTVDKTKNDISFNIDNNGLLATCGFVPKGCMDDCFTGIHIKSITAL